MASKKRPRDWEDSDAAGAGTGAGAGAGTGAGAGESGKGAGSTSPKYPIPLDVLTEVKGWFAEFGANPEFEIEARVKGGYVGGQRMVTKTAFDFVRSRLKSSTCTVRRHRTLDVSYGAYRTTHHLGPKCLRFHYPTPCGDAACEAAAPTTIAKQRRHVRDVVLGVPGAQCDVRLSVQTERAVSPMAGALVQKLRLKDRLSFLHKGVFSFDITLVRQGDELEEALKAPPTYEVELEFCGQRRFKGGKAERSAKSMLMKVFDLVAMVMDRRL